MGSLRRSFFSELNALQPAELLVSSIGPGPGSGGTRVLLVGKDGLLGRSAIGVFEHVVVERVVVELERVRTLSQLRLRAAREGLPLPRVVFVDLDMPGAAGDQLVALIQSHFPMSSLVALSGCLTTERAAHLLMVGVPSMNKPVDPMALPMVLARLAIGLSSHDRPWSPIAAKLLEPAQDIGSHIGRYMGRWRAGFAMAVGLYSETRVLSKQQRTVLNLYLGGKNNKEIARASCCSEATVYEHWRRMAKKIGGSYMCDVVADFHRFLSGEIDDLATGDDAAALAASPDASPWLFAAPAAGK